MNTRYFAKYNAYAIGNRRYFFSAMKEIIVECRKDTFEFNKAKRNRKKMNPPYYRIVRAARRLKAPSIAALIFSTAASSPLLIMISIMVLASSIAITTDIKQT